MVAEVWPIAVILPQCTGRAPMAASLRVGLWYIIIHPNLLGGHLWQLRVGLYIAVTVYTQII